MMLKLLRLWLILSLSSAAPLISNVAKEPTEDNLVTDDIARSEGMHDHPSINSTREPRLTVYGGNINFSGSISSSGENAVINIGSISTNEVSQQSTINKAASQELESKSEVQGLEQEEVFPCFFKDELLAARKDDELLPHGQSSPYDTSFQWKNNLIPYFFNSTSDKDKELFRSIMDKIEEKTCFKFEEKTKAEYEDEHSLEIEANGYSCEKGCNGGVTKSLITDVVKLKSYTQVNDRKDCELKCGGFILHELMHVLGVGHTHIRRDRDQFITVNKANWVAGGVESYLPICTDCKLYPEVPYDCDSIMHFGTHFKGRELFKPKYANTCKLKEQPKANDGPKGSDLDWKLLNMIGKCPVCVTSPGYPNNYPDNSDTEQILSVPDGHHIEITFNHFDVENHGTCSYDYLKFLDANSDPVGNKMCGQSVPQEFTISTSTASAHFYSDGSVKKTGYKFCYKPGRKTALVFLHGLDIGLSSILDCNKMEKEIPLHGSVKMVCPEAPKVTNICTKELFTSIFTSLLPNSKSWYDMCKIPGREGEDKNKLHAAFQRMEKQIEALKNEGIPSENIVLAGFSQGGSLALYTALHSEHKLGGVIGVATWLPLLTKEPPTSDTTVNGDTPVFHVNAKNDLTVAEKVGYATKEKLSKVIKDYTFELIHGNNHLDIHENKCFWPKLINWLWEKELLVLKDRPSVPTCP